MKMYRLVCLLAALFLSGQVIAQTDTIKIKTSAICGECKERIEHNLSFEKGVKSSNLDLKTKMVTVVYNPQKTDIDKIRLAIAKTGYAADELPADAKAFKRLPECCRNPAMKHKD